MTSTLTTDLTREQIENHLRHWCRKQRGATTEAERREAADKVDAWLDELLDLKAA